MLKNFLKRWGPVLMFVLVLALCAGFVAMNLADPKTDPDVVTADANKQKVEQALKAGKVSPAYIASDEQIAKIKYAEALKTDIERIKRTNDEQIGVYISYPQPARPKSEPPPPPMGQDDLVAKMPLLNDADFKAEADRGKVYVKCELPKPDGYIMMEPVRFEIFRGPSKDKIDTTKPWGTIEVGLESPPAPVPAGTSVAPVSVTPAPALNSREEAARNGRNGGGAASGRAAPPVAAMPLPPTERVFKDTTDITQQTEYFYKVRLVARFTSVDGHKEMSKRADGTTFELVRHAPNDKNLTPVPSANPTTKLYATPLTAEISATTPTNFELRFAGVIGTVPPPGFVRNPAAPNNKDYRANFGVSTWIPDLGEWKPSQVQNVFEGDVISGKVVYMKGGERKEYDYTKDLGYKLLEINNEKIESGAQGQPEIKEIAILENQKTKKMERFKLEPRPPVRKESLNAFDKLIEAQNREMKRLREAPPPIAPAPTPTPAPVPAPAAPATPTATPGAATPPPPPTPVTK